LENIISFVKKSHVQYLKELKSFLSIPSISSDPERRIDVVNAANHTAELLSNAGCSDIAIHFTKGHPIVTGSIISDPDKPTILIYGHYDVQPVDPLDLWDHDPFDAFIKDDTIIARGSADDKGQVFMHFKAAEAFMKVNGKLPINLKFIVEGEEEVASPNLAKFLSENKELLSADIVFISDTAMWAQGQPAITYGLKGLAYMELELTGPNHDLHSGEYGGAVANPAEILSRMIAQTKDADGRIQIPGFYDKVIEIDANEREMIANNPFSSDEYKAELGVEELWGEKGYTTKEHVSVRPTFEVNGIWGGFTGVGAKTVLPSKAATKISMRLVPDQDPNEIADIAEKYFKSIAPKSVQLKVIRHSGGYPVVTPLSSPYIDAAKDALEVSFNRRPLMIRAGGSIPIVADFKKILGLDTLLVGFCLPSCRAHSPNENMHLPSFFTGIESLVRMYDSFQHISVGD